jgi:hypothetical protein
MFVILCAFVTSISRTKNKRKTFKSKAKTNTKLFEWNLKDNHTYTVYLYVNDHSKYTTATFKAEVVYPANTQIHNGWNFKVSSMSGLFPDISKKKSDGSYFVDFKNCSPFVGNQSYSIWGYKGKTITSFCRATNGQSYEFTVMFEYSSYSSYITVNDLSTLVSHLNVIRNARNSELNTLKTNCSSDASTYESLQSSITNLSQPNTSMDDSIARATGEKNNYDQQAAKFTLEINTNSEIIANLQKQLAENKNNLSAAQSVDAHNFNLITLKNAELEELIKSKNSEQGQRDIQLANAKGEVEVVKNKFKSTSEQLKVACKECNAAVTQATLAFDASPYNPLTVIDALNVITVSGA